MERDPMELVVSNDLVMDIVLSHLKVIDLLSCRLVSKFWNKAASSVLRKRSTIMKNIPDEKRLMELEKCMKTSSDFPFAGLNFDKPWKLNSGGATKFFEDHGARFTRLCLDTNCTKRLNVLVPFVHHLAHLSVLEMAVPRRWSPHQHFKLFQSKAGLDGGEILNLSSLRTLRIFYPKVAKQVLRQVLRATSSSIQIECLNATPQIFGVLKKARKLRAVTFIKFGQNNRNQIYQPLMKQLLSAKSPELTKLDFSVNGCLSLDGLTDILYSSRRTLREFHFDAQHMASELADLWNDFPVLAKLTKLSLRVKIDSCLQYLFQGQHGHNFPALQEVKLVDDYSTKSPIVKVSDCQFVVGNVTKIDLQGYFSESPMEQLAQVFPNVTNIRLGYGSYSSLRREPCEVWNVGAFKCLESLRIWNYNVQQPRKHRIGMDSFLTGMSAGICYNLQKQEQLNPVDSPMKKVLRESPSILQLKNLKELIICLKLECGKLPEDPPFMSMVSVWYALEMMPKLRTTFTYEVSLPRSRDEVR